MKQLVSIIICVALFGACTTKQGRKKGSATSGTDSLINTSGTVAPEEFREGARLITVNDCLTCHQLEKKTVGPSYREIARKYPHSEGNVDNLVISIIRGSRNIWGPQVMTPHPEVPVKDAQAMVRYIFSLDSTHTKDTTGTRPK